MEVDEVSERFRRNNLKITFSSNFPRNGPSEAVAERLKSPHPWNQGLFSQDPSWVTALGEPRGECGFGAVDSARVSRCVIICS